MNRRAGQDVQSFKTIKKRLNVGIFLKINQFNAD